MNFKEFYLKSETPEDVEDVESEIEEKLIKKVLIRNGKKLKVKRTDKEGFKTVKDSKTGAYKEKRIMPVEKRNREKSAKKASVKRKFSKSKMKKSRLKSIKMRKRMGL